MDYEEFKSHVDFKSFTAKFGAALQTFDKAKDWADLVTTLASLAKVCFYHSVAHNTRFWTSFQLSQSSPSAMSSLRDSHNAAILLYLMDCM